MGMPRLATAWGELLLPTRCLGCGGAGVGRGPEPVCPACRTRLSPLPGPACPRCQHPPAPGGGPCELCRDWPSILYRARSVTRFRPPASTLVQSMKYEGWRSVAPLMGRVMAREGSRADLPRADAVVPVPTTPGRLRSRGFNPAALLAEVVARELGVPLLSLLERPAEGPRQVGLPPSRRAANVKNAFVFRGSPVGSPSHETVLLVDDVLTTGVTGAAATEVLGHGGVDRVVFLTFARALPDLPGPS